MQALNNQQVHEQLASIPGWKVVEDHHLTRTFAFKDFNSALDFVNKIGSLAEEQNHHPDIFLTWGKVKIDSWTHTANGITGKDFDLAKFIDELYA